MVDVSIEGDRIHLEVQALDKLWSFRSHLDFPLAHVTSVRADPEPARGWWHGIRLLGSQIPGILTAGTFYEQGGVVFYDVHDPELTIVLELNHERYERLIVEVEDPAAAVKTISAAIAPKRR
jgi:hypothetical protein